MPDEPSTSDPAAADPSPLATRLWGHRGEADTPARLPRGPHRIPRAEVVRAQRDRLLLAMIEEVAERGYAATAVADVLRRAQVSRATFYELFAGKGSCFRAAYEASLALLADVLRAEVTASPAACGAEAPALVERLLTTYLRTLQGAPAFARLFLVEVYAAGPEVAELRRRSLEAFVDLVIEARQAPDATAGTAEDQRFEARALVGMVSFLVTDLVAVGETHRLLELREPILRLAAELRW